MADVVPGVIGTVRIAVLTVSGDGLSAGVRVLDNNNAPVTATASIPAGVITVVASVVAVGDVMQHVSDGLTAVVRWVDPVNAMNWSPAASGSPVQSSSGWIKVGTATFTP